MSSPIAADGAEDHRILVIGLDATVNREVVSSLVEAGLVAEGSTDPVKAVEAYDAKRFTVIAFGRGILGPVSDRLKTAFAARNPQIRFVDVIGPMAVDQVIAACRNDPEYPLFVRDLAFADGEKPRFMVRILRPCRLRITLFTKEAGDLSSTILADLDAIEGALHIPLKGPVTSPYSLVVEANGQEFLHYPFLTPAIS